MAKIDDEVAAIVAMWSDGMLTEHEIPTKLLELLTATNIGEVVAATPEPWRAVLVESLHDIAASEGPLLWIGGVVQTADAAREAAAKHADFENVIRPAIRAWLRSARI